MAVNNALAFRQIAELRDRLNQEKQYLEEEINLENHFEDIVGESTGLRQVLKDIETVAPTDATRADPGRNGHRQRITGARHSSPESAQGADLYEVELRGHSCRLAGK